MTLFLDGIFNSEGISKLPPSAVKIFFPVLNTQTGTTRSYESLQGLLTTEVTVSSQVKWGTILNDVSNLQAIASLLGSSKMWTWIGASTMCWYGTEPLKTDFEFYLINYKRGLRLESKLKDLNMLTAMVKAGHASVFIHGGYTPPVLSTNASAFNNNQEQENISSGGILGKLDQLVGGALTRLGEGKEGDHDKGTISVLVGNKLMLSRMLVQRLNVTPSVVEVVDGLPLYYRVSMSLTGNQPLLSTQVEEMYREF